MKKYQRRISFKTLLLVFIRRWKYFLLFFVPTTVVLAVVTQAILPKTYLSTVSLKRYDSVIKEEQYYLVKNTAFGTYVVSTTVENLQSNNIRHADGSAITNDDILSGLVCQKMPTNSIYVTFSFETKDKTIIEPVLQYIADLTIYALNKSGEFKGMVIGIPVSAPQKSNKNTRLFLAGTFATLAISFVFAFIMEIVFDEVYDNSDIELLGARSYEIKLPKLKKEDKQDD